MNFVQIVLSGLVNLIEDIVNGVTKCVIWEPERTHKHYRGKTQIYFINYIRVITNLSVAVYLQVNAKGSCTVKCSRLKRGLTVYVYDVAAHVTEI